MVVNFRARGISRDVRKITHIYIYIYLLVDRKRNPAEWRPAEWRKRIASIRARISKEFASLPKEIDPNFQTLDPEGSFRFVSLIFIVHIFYLFCS